MSNATGVLLLLVLCDSEEHDTDGEHAD